MTDVACVVRLVMIIIFLQPPCPSTPNILPFLWSWTSNFKWTLPSLNDDQSSKKKIRSKHGYYMLSGYSFWLAFVFSINSLILSDFPLTSFHLACKASLSALTWSYTLVCAVVQKCHNYFVLFFILLFIIIHIFSNQFAVNLFCLNNFKMWTNYGTTSATCMWMNKIKEKKKLSHITFKLTMCYVNQFCPKTT